jgi:hypothetical protein
MGTKKTYRVVSDHGVQAADDRFIGALLAFSNGDSIEIIEASPHHPIELGGDLAEMRSEFRELLNLAIDDRAALAARFFMPIGMQLINSMKVKRTIIFGNHGFSLGYHQSFGNVRSALHYAIALMLDLKLPYRNAISRCRWQHCGIFYLAKKNPRGGPANRFYCCPKHRIEAHDSKQNRKHK